MKKLLALLLVLGLASMANAAISLSTSPMGEAGSFVPAVSSEIVLMTSDTIWIGVDWDGMPGGVDTSTIILEGPASWTGQTQLFAPPALPSAALYNLVDYGYGMILYNSTPSATEGPGIGTQGAYQLHCDGEGEVIVQVRDLAGGIIQDLVIHQIPEPLTLSLLGLGGLGLLRRRR
jgi:hypothetical protein